MKTISMSAGVLLLAVSLYLSTKHPLFPFLAPILLTGYLAVLCKFNHLWISMIFMALPILDFGMWTGNILYSEYDILAIGTIGFLLIKDYVKPKYVFRHEWFYFIYLLTFITSLLIGLHSYFEGYSETPDMHLSYLSAIRVGKGFFYAWIFWYFVRNRLVNEQTLTLRQLGYGISIGVFLFSMTVLWERHVFSSLVYGNGIYEFLSTLLDFSSTYRITGLFSGMHVGGTAVDGYIICTLPAIFYIMHSQRNIYLWVLCALILLLSLYCLISTFTRMTIASGLLSITIATALIAFHGLSTVRQNMNSMIQSMLALTLATLVLFACYKYTGYQGCGLGVLALVLNILIGHHRKSIQFHALLTSVSTVSLITSLGIYDSIYDSKWHDDTPQQIAILQAVLYTLSLTGLGLFVGIITKNNNTPLALLRTPLIACAALMFVIIGATSTRMDQRFKEVSGDIGVRKTHWQEVINSRTPDSLLRSVLGDGMGSMPRRYYSMYFSEKALQSYDLIKDSDNNILKIGSGGYPFHQKTSLKPNKNYTAKVTFRTEEKNGRLELDICQKNILFSESWQPNRIENIFTAKYVDWHTYEWNFNSGKLGSNGWLDWPVTIIFRNIGKNPIEIRAVELLDDQGVQLLKNYNFKDSLDHWFWSSDFEHLPWHSKQLFIHIWLEQGWVGLTIFITLTILAITHQLKLLTEHNQISTAFIPTIAGIIALGITDTFIDEPQISFLAFLTLFSSAQWPKQTNH